jgi:protein phosphatase
MKTKTIRKAGDAARTKKNGPAADPAFNSRFFDYTIAAASRVDIGKRRPSNQDAVLFRPGDGLFAVADGMGGLSHGGDASALLSTRFALQFGQTIARLPAPPAPKSAGVLFAAELAAFSDKLYEETHYGDSIDYGTTFTGLWLVARHAVFVNLGDSRAYLATPRSALRPITDDHNAAARSVRQGLLTREEARGSREASMLYCFAGMRPPAQPDVFVKAVPPGSRILLCSDGLHGLLGDAEIETTVALEESSEAICQRLVEQANAAGGRDNIAVVLIKVG